MPSSATPDAERPAPILTIDTSSAQGGIALYDGHALSERSWPAARSHTTTLLVEIHHLLEAAARAVTDLAAVAVALGPGTFTGLRVGLGVAKGFHLATDVPLLGVSTLEAAALPFAPCGHAVVATVSAGRGRLVWAHYAPGPDGTAATRPPRNGTPEELAAELAELAPNFVVVTGELDEEQAARLSHLPHVAIPAPPLRIRQPGALAEIAWQRWRAGERDDASAIEPIYLAR